VILNNSTDYSYLLAEWI